jgi:hypothetical protein
LYFHVEWTIQEFCEMFSVLVSVAVLLPSLAYGAGSDATIKWFTGNNISDEFALPGIGIYELNVVFVHSGAV